MNTTTSEPVVTSAGHGRTLADVPSWETLFRTALDVSGAVKVAAKLGYRNHTLVSRIAAGHVPASAKFQKRVIEAYHTVICPHTNKVQQRAACRIALTAAPTHHPGALQQWRACQRCPHKPEA